MDDVDRVLAIADRYGVEVTVIPNRFYVLFGSSRGLKIASRDDLTPHATRGPNAHFCDVRSRRVWFEHLDPNCCEEHLHELCHVIMQPPGGNIERLSEDVALMPFERVLARQCLSADGYRRVVRWQENTQIEWWDKKRDCYYDALEDVLNYSRWALWRESFAALRRMGAIKNGRVTWKWPNWNRAPKRLLARGNLT